MNNWVSYLSNNLIIIIFLVAIGLSFYLGGKLQAPEIITETEVVTDTLTVEKQIVDTVYVEIIPPAERDTVYLLPDNMADLYEDGFRNITTSYSDSNLVAKHELQIEQKSGDITKTAFTYILKRRIVRDREVHFTTEIRTIERTTRTIKEGMYFQAGILTNLDYFTPVVGVTTRNKITLIYGYDPFTKTHTAGILAKF